MMAILAGIFVGLLTAFLLFKWLFGDLDEFLQCIKFVFMPDIISLLRGQWDKDWWGELKIIVWLVMTALMGYGTYAKVLAW